MGEATGKMRELLVRAWLRPFIVGLSLWIGICARSWATMHWLARSIQDRIETRDMTDLQIAGGREMLAEIEETTWAWGCGKSTGCGT